MHVYHYFKADYHKDYHNHVMMILLLYRYFNADYHKDYHNRLMMIFLFVDLTNFFIVARVSLF
jgi:hypothetical protein